MSPESLECLKSVILFVFVFFFLSFLFICSRDFVEISNQPFMRKIHTFKIGTIHALLHSWLQTSA